MNQVYWLSASVFSVSEGCVLSGFLGLVIFLKENQILKQFQLEHFQV
jgi:hypothetical protein